MGLLDTVIQKVTFPIDGLVDYLVKIAYDILFAIFYPVYAIIKTVLSWIVFIWDSFYNLIDNCITFTNNVISYVYTLFFSWLPAPILALLIIGLFIVLAMFIYRYVSDIEILGFKI